MRARADSLFPSLALPLPLYPTFPRLTGARPIENSTRDGNNCFRNFFFPMEQWDSETLLMIDVSRDVPKLNTSPTPQVTIYLSALSLSLSLSLFPPLFYLGTLPFPTVMASSQCFDNPPILSSTSGVGSVQELGGLKTYVTGPQDSNLAILLISDVFGYEAPKLRKLADKVSANGFLVVVPDFFYGDPYGDPIDPKLDREAWRKAHGKDKGCEDAKTVISALRSKGVTSVGAAGFCWGGVVVVKLASSDYIQAGVVLHPGRITEDEINEVKCPISILGAEIDNASPPEQMKHFGEILSAKPGVDSLVKIFPGVNHGWSVRYDDDNESAVKSAEESHEDMLDWFTKYIK